MNIMKTAMLLAAMTALFMGVGFLIGGQSGMLIAFVIAAGMNLFSYWNADKMVLRMHNAREIDEDNAPEFFAMIRDLSANAGLPMPKVYIIDNPQPNAFATGRNPENSAVAATTGLLDALKPEEIAGVMAHELAHIQNRDTLIMTVTATIAGAISMLGNFAFIFGGNRDNGNSNPLGFIGVLAAMIVAPMAAMMVQMAISRTREYSADRRGAEICGNPQWLASALEKIASGASRIVNEDAEHNPATAHMFIINPLSGQRMDNLFSTHPDTANRVGALMQMMDEPGFARLRSGRSPAREETRAPSRREAPAVRDDKPDAGPWGARKEPEEEAPQPAPRPRVPTTRWGRNGAGKGPRS